MIHISAHLADGRFWSGSAELDAARTALVDYDEWKDFDRAWIDLATPTPEELAWLGSTFRFHPLAIEDCTHFDQRSKIEEYSDHLFVVIHGLAPSQPGSDCRDIKIYELHCFLTQNLVVTVHDVPVAAIKVLREQISRDRNKLPKEADFILYKVLDAVVEANPTALDALETEIELVDERILGESSTARALEMMHGLQQQLNQARRAVHPQRDVLRPLYEGELPYVSERARHYFRDVSDHVERVSNWVEELRERVWSIREVSLAVSAQRTNDTMKRLTVFSVVFLPLTFVTGFFGMNFEHIPWKNAQLFVGTLAIVVLLPPAVLYWLNRRQWL